MIKMDDFNAISNLETDQQSLYQRKYYALKRKCEEVQQTNEKLVNRIHHVKRILCRRKKERKFLMAKLDEYGDGYMNVQLPAMFDEMESETLDNSFMGQKDDDAVLAPGSNVNIPTSSKTIMPFVTKSSSMTLNKISSVSSS